MGGRKPAKDLNISPEEEERRRVRRERNKAAAARCRKRRVDHTNALIEVGTRFKGSQNLFVYLFVILNLYTSKLDTNLHFLFIVLIPLSSIYLPLSLYLCIFSRTFMFA